MTGKYSIFGIPIIYYSLRLRAKYHGDVTLKHRIHSIVLRDLELLLMSFGKLAFRSKASKSSDILTKPPKTHQGSHKTLELARLNVIDLVRRGGSVSCCMWFSWIAKGVHDDKRWIVRGGSALTVWPLQRVIKSFLSTLTFVRP